MAPLLTGTPDFLLGAVDDVIAPMISPGRYRHYKGGEYTVYGVARHSESGELLVVYRPCYGERELWVRPLAMFVESVRVDGSEVPRFERIAGPDEGG